MVVGAFPAAKLAVLAFKQLSKPVANVLKERAKHSPFFRQYICMPPAQFYNWVEVRTKMWSMNLGKPASIPQLNETMAIELGANLLGEIVIFSIGAGLLMFEYVRQSNKEAAREEAIQEEKRHVLLSIQELSLKLEAQDAQIRHLTRTVAALDSPRWLPKILKSSKDDDSGNVNQEKPISLKDTNNNNNTESVSSDNVIASDASHTGNYDPNDGVLFESLNLIENEIFYSEKSTSQGHRVIEDALAYLKLDVYE